MKQFTLGELIKECKVLSNNVYIVASRVNGVFGMLSPASVQLGSLTPPPNFEFVCEVDVCVGLESEKDIFSFIDSVNSRRRL